MKRIAVLYSEYLPTIDALRYRLDNVQIDCFTNKEELIGYDLVILLDNKLSYAGEAIICHHSLLPAFNTSEPVRDAIVAGVKVTGITIYYKNSGEIITQYPILIKNESHFDEIEQELNYLEQTLLPIIIEKILNNKIIDITTLLKHTNHCNGCHGGGCISCKH